MSKFGNPFAMFETDPNLERNGIDIDYGAFYITVARAGGANDRFRDVLRAKLAPYRRALETETMDDDLADKLAREAFAETVVTGWGRIDKDDDNKEVRTPGVMPWKDGEDRPFNADAVKELFELLPDFAKDVMGQAQRTALFRKALAEIDGKN